jgi:hypothetical protein
MEFNWAFKKLIFVLNCLFVEVTDRSTPILLATRNNKLFLYPRAYFKCTSCNVCCTQSIVEQMVFFYLQIFCLKKKKQQKNLFSFEIQVAAIKPGPPGVKVPIVRSPKRHGSVVFREWGVL